jgi:hypothetical protein
MVWFRFVPLQDPQPVLVELMDDLSNRLATEADQRPGRAHPLAPGTGQDDLGPTEDKGVRRTQGGLQGPALRVRQCADVQWFRTHCHSFAYCTLTRL